MPTSSDNADDGISNPSNTSIRKVLNSNSSQHSFQHRLDDYHSIMDDDYDDRVAEAKSSSRSTQQRKSFSDTTQTVPQTLGTYAKSSSALSEMSKEAEAEKTVPSSVADHKAATPSSSSSKDEVSSPGASSRFHVARPHHLPKMNGLSGLSGNLEKIRKSMGEEVGLAQVT